MDLPLEVIRFSPRLDELLLPGAALHRLACGFLWAEGPLWLAEEAALLFSDIPADALYRWSPTQGVTIFRKPSRYANGNARDAHGNLLTCEHGTRSVTRTSSSGKRETLAWQMGGKRLNSPNDLAMRSDGWLYFTDPDYGFSDRMGSTGERELEVQGVYRIPPGGGESQMVASDFCAPNGLAFSPDERRLYVNDSDHMHVRVFSVLPEGALAGGEVFAVLDSQYGDGWPDGMKTDALGNVYVTGPAGIWIFNPQGEALGILRTPETATNMAWGGESLRELFITTARLDYQASCLYRLMLAVGGCSAAPRTGLD